MKQQEGFCEMEVLKGIKRYNHQAMVHDSLFNSACVYFTVW